MPVSLTIAELVDAFPDFRVAVIVAEGLSVAAERPPGVDAEIARREAACRTAFSGVELSAIPGIAAWRRAYRAFGIKRTSYRSSVERLVKRVTAGDALPRVNAFVDAYNAVSLAHHLCVGADDLDRIEPPLAFRTSREGDSFLDMGTGEGADPNDPPKPGEVVLADARHVLCRRWNWRQDMRSAISPDTKRAVATIQSNGWGDLDAAVEDFRALVAASCGARTQVAVADKARPTVSVG
jgi:DNA/RNA-binding domain of Phe-tRNA-synthetase-like protein